MSADNGFHLIGNLTRDAELKYTNSGTAVCKFSIAHNKKYKNAQGSQVEEVSFFECTLWGKAAESLNQYLTKGKLIAVEGEMKQDRWEQDGQARSKIEFKVENLRLLPSGNREGGGGSATDDWGEAHRQSNANAQSANRKPAPASSSAGAKSAAGPSDDGFTDDIPF